MRYLPYIALGAVSMLFQITLLRELLTVFAGNELDIGITLALWLLFTGAGSMTGSRIKGPGALSWVFLAASFLALPTLLAVEYIRPVLGLGFGEGASLGATFISTAVVLLPLCFLLGMGFPLSIVHYRSRWKDAEHPAARIYGYEAAGAFVSGVLFTFVLAGRVDAAWLLTGTAIVSAAVGLMLYGKRLLIPFIALPVMLHLGIVNYVLPSLKDDSAFETVRTVQSRYGEIRVTGLGGQLNVYSAGHLVFSYPDTSAEEMGVHLPMSLAPGARSVLAIGGSPGMIREFLKYPLQRLDFVETDPVLVSTAMSIALPEDRAAMNSPKVSIHTVDGRRFIQGREEAVYDMVVMNLPPPSTANLNRFYTKNFFREVRSVLGPDGVFVFRMPTSGGYVGRRMMQANGSVYHSLNTVFPHAGVSTEEYGLFYASLRPVGADPSILIARFGQAGIVTKQFAPYVLHDAFSPGRVTAHTRRLTEVKDDNTDMRPMAYLYNLMLWAEMHGTVILNRVLEAGPGGASLGAAVVFMLFGAAVFRRREPTVYYSVATTGFAAMGMSVAIILGYQAALGFVYERIGLLSAVFMAGMALGALVFRRGGLGRLAVLELLVALFALAAPVMFGSEVVFYILSTSAGVLTGGLFAVASHTISGTSREGGKLYAFDLLGSFLGAALVAVFLVPLMGVAGALSLIAGVKLLSAFLVWAAGGRLFDRLSEMSRVRAFMVFVLVFAFAASFAVRAVSPEAEVDETLYLQEVAPDTEFAPKGGSPPHYKSDTLGVAFNTHDIAPGIKGYAGPIKLLLALSPEGKITGIRILEHRETPNYVRGMERAEFLGQFLGKSVNDPLEVDQDIDGVSRATVSVEALTDTVRVSSRRVARDVLGMDVSAVEWRGGGGLSWAVLLVFMTASFLAYLYTRRKVPLARRRGVRDVVLVLGVVVLGLWLSSPFSVLHVLNLLMLRISGDPMWLVLVVAVGISMIVAGRFYCGWLCPFGALSEFTARLPVRKWDISPETDARWRKLKYLVLATVVLAVVPTGKAEYGNFEPYVTIFSFYGNVFAWSVAGVALIASLRVRRFWCRYLCPVGAVTGLCSPPASGYASRDSCPMNNSRDPHISECIRCNYCFSHRSTEKTLDKYQ